LFFAPIAVIEEWKKTPAETRKAAEEKMRGEWGQWMGQHGKSVSDTAGAGKTKRITATGVADTRNDVMLYSIVQAESHDEAAAMFKGHPHLQIPEASIEVMEINPLSGG
jgi:hypothetical protein